MADTRPTIIDFVKKYTALYSDHTFLREKVGGEWTETSFARTHEKDAHDGQKDTYGGNKHRCEHGFHLLRLASRGECGSAQSRRSQHRAAIALV